MPLIFRFLSFFPLWLLHGLGTVLGWLSYLSPTYRMRFRENAAQAGFEPSDVRGAIAQSGKLVAELPRLWLGKPVPISWESKHLIEQAHAKGQAIVFLTPHMGCFEITAQAYARDYGAKHGDVTVLFRPARKAWLAPLVDTARQRPGLSAAPATLAGVKQLIKAIQSGKAVGLLPDQVPPEGLGIWSPFFERPAYTMTLSVRLARQANACPLLIWGERLSWGRGYRVHLRTMTDPLAKDTATAVAQINRAMERLIRECPEQYLWGYARYKAPRSASTVVNNT